MSPLRERILRNSLWLFLLTVVGRFSWLLSLLIFAGAVGIDLYGEFTFYMAFALVVSRFSGLGLEIWLNREISSTSRADRTLINRILIVRLLLVGAGITIFSSLALALYSEAFLFLPLFVLVLIRQLIESLREVVVGGLQGLQKMKVQAKASLPYDVAQLLVISLLVFVMDVTVVEALVGAMAILSALRLLQLYRSLIVYAEGEKGGWASLFHSLSSPDGRRMQASILKQSFYLGLGFLFALLLGKMHVFFLRYYTDTKTVGSFAIAILFVEGCLILLGAVRQALFPALNSIRAIDGSKFFTIVNRSLLFFTLASMGLSVVLASTANILLAYKVIPVDYEEALHCLLVVAWVLPAMACSGAIGSNVISAGLERQAVRAQVVGVGVAFGCNLLLIPYIGMLGAVIAIVMGYSCVGLLNWRELIQYKDSEGGI